MSGILEFRQVSYRYPGQEQLALRELTVTLPVNQKIAVVGRNGAGKSTLFLHCNGLFRPLSGEVRFRDRRLAYDRASLRELRRRVGVVFQNPDDQLFSASVAQDISFGPLNLGLGETEVRRRVAAAAEMCGVTSLLDRATHSLSGGEKARVALAGVLAMEPEVLVADEPLGSLDPWMRLALFDILERFYERGNTIVMATHDVAVVRHWATYVIVMDAGAAVFAGPPAALLDDQTLLTMTGLAHVWQHPDALFGRARPGGDSTGVAL